MYVGRYSYEDLHREAVANPTHDNLMALGEWFRRYGMEYWNGEYFDADGDRLVPIYELDAEADVCEIVDYRLC